MEVVLHKIAAILSENATQTSVMKKRKLHEMLAEKKILGRGNNKVLQCSSRFLTIEKPKLNRERRMEVQRHNWELKNAQLEAVRLRFVKQRVTVYRMKE